MVIAFIILLLFGYKRLPELVKGLGSSVVGFKRAMIEAKGVEEEMYKDKEKDEYKL